MKLTLKICLFALFTARTMAAILVDKSGIGDSLVYVFAYSWTPEYCYSLTNAPGCESPEDFWGKYFTIHGLWPQYSTTGYPSYCTTEAFNSTVIDVIGWDTMTTYWPNVGYAVTDPDYTEFWDHEWTKHGTCSGLTQLSYFQAAVSLAKSYGTPGILTAAVGSTLSASSLRSAMGGTNDVALQCSSSQYLNGAYTCWGRNSATGAPTTQITCPSDVPTEDTCSATTLTIESF